MLDDRTRCGETVVFTLRKPVPDQFAGTGAGAGSVVRPGAGAFSRDPAAYGVAQLAETAGIAHEDRT